MPQTNKLFPKNTKSKPHPFWRWFWLTFLVLSLAYAWYSFYAPATNIEWVKNSNSIQEFGKTPNRHTLLFFTGQWCSPCRIMKRDVFSDKTVEALIKAQFTPVMVDVDKPNSKALVAHYNIQSTPTTLIVNPNGEVLDYAVGRIKKKKFLKMLNDIKTK